MVVMDWSGETPCAFKIAKEKITPCSQGWHFDVCCVDFSIIPLSKYEKKNLRFTYGETGEWILDVVFQKPSEDAPDYPIMLKANGMSPPEDIGGLHNYYQQFGKDSYSKEWPGYEVPMDEDLFEDINNYFSEEWSRIPPMDMRKIDAKTMKIIMTALADPTSDYVFDKNDWVVIPIGSARGEISEVEIDKNVERYIPVVPHDPAFPYSRASRFPNSFRYLGRQGDLDDYLKFITGLKGEDKVNFDEAILNASLDELLMWASSNRLNLDMVSFLKNNPDILHDRIRSNMIDFISNVGKEHVEREAKYNEVLCPRCAAPCRGKVDKTQIPSNIGSTKIHPMVIVCEKCGRSTTLRYLNDGFNRGYTYPEAQGPAIYMEDAIKLSAQVASEKDPVKKIALYTNLAGAYWRTRDLDFMVRTLNKITAETTSKKRYVKIGTDATLRMTALWLYVGKESKEIKQSVRKLKNSIETLKGPYAALFVACCCRESKGTERIHRCTRGLWKLLIHAILTIIWLCILDIWLRHIHSRT